MIIMRSRDLDMTLSSKVIVKQNDYCKPEQVATKTEKTRKYQIPIGCVYIIQIIHRILHHCEMGAKLANSQVIHWVIQFGQDTSKFVIFMS